MQSKSTTNKQKSLKKPGSIKDALTTKGEKKRARKPSRKARTSSKKPTAAKTDKSTISSILSTSSNDWPIGPPGYGFPGHLADLDGVLIKATGDGSKSPHQKDNIAVLTFLEFSATCAGGFTSSLVCSLGGDCPPGLFCDRQLFLCCPLILPLNDPNNPTKPGQPHRRHRKEESTRPKNIPAYRFSSMPCNMPCPRMN